MSAKNVSSENKAAAAKTGKLGTYTVIVTLLVLAACIVLNLAVASVPATYTRFDTTSNKIYTLSAATRRFVGDLAQDVTLYYICEGGQEDEQLRTFIDRYEAESSHITIKTVDPVRDPSFLDSIGATDADNWSVAVCSDRRTKVVRYSDMYYYYNENYGQISAEEYSQMYSYYGSYLEAYYGTFTEYFGGDARITGAIEYVTAENVPAVYMLDGHGETEFAATLTENVFSYAGVTTEKINIALDGEEIPDDCDLLIINVPTMDLTASEAAKLSAFFDKGGNILLITSAGCDSFANLMSFTASLGMSASSGTVSEGDSSAHYSRQPQLIYPSVSAAHDATAGYASNFTQYKVLVPYAHAIEFNAVQGVSLSELLYTSTQATAGDGSGTSAYALAAAAEKGSGRLIWIGSSQMLTDTFINATAGANLYCFFFMFSWLHDAFTSGLPDIPQIDMTPPTLSVSEGQANAWGAVLIFIVPGAVLAGGLIYWLRRRRS